MLEKLLSVRCAPVSERTEACKEAKGKQKTKKPNTGKQRTNKPTKINTTKPNKNTRNTTTNKNSCSERQVKLVRRNPHRMGEKRVYEALELPQERKWQGSYGLENYRD